MLECNNVYLFFLHKEFIEFIIDYLAITISTFVQNYMVLMKMIICNNCFLLLEFFFNDEFFFNNNYVNCFFV